jgi:ubiquinone/menaquinone biosynthesis C-methylase UbiE
MVHHNICPLCSSEKIGLHFGCIDHFLSKKDFKIFECLSCGFLFTQDYPGEREINQFYESEEYISHSDTSEGFSNNLYRRVRSIMLRRKKDLIIKTTGLKSGTLLDIGSGTGYFAMTMKKAGWTVKGIEINEKARAFSKSRFGLEIEAPEAISSLEANSRDCITLWHVLEHFHDPFKYVSEIHRLLKPGAICVIALPNSNSYDAKHYNRFWAAWDVPRHLWHFNPDTFRLFSENWKFTNETFRVLPLDVFYISQLSEKYKGSTLPFLKGVAKAFVFAIKSAFNKKKSSTTVYILRKPAT